MSKKIRLRVPKKISYAKAIREKRLECTCNQPNEVKYCTITDCALFPYRFGTSPETYLKRYEENIIVIK